jgi:hypothetical protein
MKILSHKSWFLKEKTLIQIYNVLIRSIIDYSVILSPIISKTNLNTLQIIQNNALRIIFKKPLMSRNTSRTKLIFINFEIFLYFSTISSNICKVKT